MENLWTYRSDSCGYMLYFDGKPVRGARTNGTATHTSDGRRRHWKHVRADALMHSEQAATQCARLNAAKALPT